MSTLCQTPELAIGPTLSQHEVAIDLDPVVLESQDTRTRHLHVEQLVEIYDHA